MPDAASGALTGSVEAVLERMFFITPAGNPAPDAGEPAPLAARVRFSGAAAGSLTVEISPAAAASIAADFLAVDAGAVEPGQVQDVFRELANMLCGAALSRLHGDRVFHLDAPETLQGPVPTGTSAARCSVALGPGTLTAVLAFDEPCPTTSGHAS